MRFEVWAVALDIHIGSQKDRVAFARGLVCCGSGVSTDHTEPAVRKEERTKAIPIARFSRGAGDYVIERCYEVLDRVHIAPALRGRPNRGDPQATPLAEGAQAG